MKFQFDTISSEIEKLRLELKNSIEDGLITDEYIEPYGQYTDKISQALIVILLKEEKKQNKNSGNTDSLKTIDLNDISYLLSSFEEDMEEAIDVALNRNIHTTTLERIRGYAMDCFLELAAHQPIIENTTSKKKTLK